MLAYDPVMVLQKVSEQVEDKRLHGNRRVATAQIARVGVKCVIGKEKLHETPETMEPPRSNIKAIYRKNQSYRKVFRITSR